MKKERFNFFSLLALFVNILYYTWVFISPFILVSLVGFFIWLGTSKIVFLYTFIVLGFIIGLLFVIRVRKKGGAIKLMGTLYSTPEFEKK